MFDRFIADAARTSPSAIAVSTLRGDVTYGGFDADIDRMAAALAPRLAPGDLVSLNILDPYSQWLTIFGLARLRCPCTFAADLPAALHVTDQPAPPPGALILHDEWLRATLLAPRPSLPPPPETDPDAIGQILESSGTTGQPKKIARSWQDIIDSQALYPPGLTPGSGRSLILGGPQVRLGWGCLYVWAARGTVLFGPPLPDLPATLPDLRPDVIVAATGQLAALLKFLPAGFRRMDGLRIVVGGSALTPRLAAEAVEKLAGTLQMAYGSSETMLVAYGPATLLTHHPRAVGHVVPGGNEVQIVDETGTPLPPGAEGTLRVRGHHVITHYMDGTRLEAFRDGWFYPGDLGRLDADGLLHILGRADEVMNFGGLKLLPQDVEERALAVPGVSDAALVSIEREGVPRAHLALVRDEAAFDEAALRAAMPPGLAPVLVWVDAIPRNRMAKIDRRILVAALE